VNSSQLGRASHRRQTIKQLDDIISLYIQ